MKTLIIAEIGVNHNGNIKIAKKLIDVAKKAGCDFVKFQSFKANNLTRENTKAAFYQKKNLKKNISQKKMLEKYELSENDHKVILKYCKRKKINFISSPFDNESLQLLFKLNQFNIKIPSGEITHYALLKAIAKGAKKIILSSGMSNLNEIKNALRIIQKHGFKKKNVIVLHCHSDYPTQLKDVNLRALKTIKKKLGVEVGYSDHTLGYETSIAAITMGAKIIEKHITLSKKMIGPDHAASLEPDQLYKFVNLLRNTEVLLGSHIKKPTKSELKIKKLVRKSIVAKSEISKGEVFSEKNIISKRPEGGIPSIHWNRILGKKSKYFFKKDDYIKI